MPVLDFVTLGIAFVWRAVGCAADRKWLPVVVNWLCKTVGMMVAWTVQRILSAAHSAMRGGFMAARHAMEFIAQRSGKKFDADKS